MAGLGKKVLRTMLEHKSQYIGAAVLVALSCMVFTAFNIMGVNVEDNLAEFKNVNVQEDASFILANNLNDEAALEAKYNAVIERRGCADADYDGSSTLRILSATEKVDKYAVVKGEALSGDGDILVDPAFADAHGIELGDFLAIFGKSFRVCGYVSTPDYIYPLKNEDDMMKNPNAFGIAVISGPAFEALGEGYRFYSVKFGDTDRTAFKNELSEENTVVKWVDQADNMRISFINGDIKGVRPMGTVLPLAILLLTCMLVSVVLGRLLRREYAQTGLLFALGYRRGEILRHYMAYPLAISAAGGLAGTAAGALLVKPFLSYVSSFYNLPVINIDYLPSCLVLSFVLPFLFLLPTAFFVIARALRMSPLQLIRGGVKNSEVSRLEKGLRLQHFKFAAKFKIREVVRNVPRTGLLLLGVICASVLLLLGFATKDSMNALLGEGLTDVYRYQYVYSFNSLQTEDPASGEKVTLSPFTVSCGEDELTAAIYGIQPDAELITLSDSGGNRLDYGGTIVTRALADRLGLVPGDVVTVKNKLTGKSDTLKVNGIAEFYLGDFIYMPIGQLNNILGYPENSYLQLYSEKKLDIPASALLSVTDRQYLLDSFDSILKPIEAMSVMIGAGAFVIGLIILYVVTSLLIEENRESVSLLKILGYGNKKLYSLLLNPYTVFVVLGYAVSIPIVLYSLGKFFYIMTAQMNISIPARLNVPDIFIGFFIILAAYLLSGLLNRRKIVSISMTDSLKSKWE
jgi:putative ABC transport system permease protein